MKVAVRENLIDTVTSDERLFEQLHESYWPALFRIASRKTGDQDDAYDLLQELFIELWDKRHVYPLANLSLPWLKKRLWFKLIAYFRARGFQRGHLENFRIFIEQEQAIDRPYESGDPDLESQYEILRDAVALTVAQMPERMKEVFLLNREHHFTIPEIATRLGLSPNTVRNHLQAAMKRLRHSLQERNLSAMGLTLAYWVLFASH